MNLLVYFGIAALVVFLDLFTKFLVKGSEVLMSGGVIELIPGAFRFRYVENPGAAMGSFAGNRWVFMLFSTVAIIGILIFLIKYRKTASRLCGVSLALIMGGGIGNMYERLFNQNQHGQYVVTDFFDFYFFDFWKWVFNLADVAVCIGAGLMILYLILDLYHDYRYRKHPAEYDELVALDGLETDGDSLADLMALDGVDEEPESPLIWTAENDPADGAEALLEESFGENLPDGEDDDVDDGSDCISELFALDGGYETEDSFPIYSADDVDEIEGSEEENDFFVEDDDEDDDLL